MRCQLNQNGISIKTWFKELSFSSRERREIIDLTGQVLEAAKQSSIKNGLLVVQLPHATAALMLNEDEKGLKHDILNKLDDLVPARGGYQHDSIDDNAHAHLKSALVGSSVVLPIVDSQIIRGTWQSFLVVEQDGPRRRKVSIFVIGE